MPKKVPANQRVERHSLRGELNTRKLPGDHPVQARNVNLSVIRGDLAAPVDTGYALTSGNREVERAGQVSVDRSLLGACIHQRGAAKRWNRRDGVSRFGEKVEADSDLQRRSVAN